MNKAFQDVYSDLCEPKLFDLERLLRILRPAGDFGDDLLTAMQDRSESKDWGCLCKLIWIAHWFPDRKFTSLLCDLLDNHRHEVLMEAVTDALLIIKDERSVPSLIKALDHYVNGDDYFHVNRKLINALERIGTTEALDGIRLAAGNQHEVIREHALKALERIRGSFNGGLN